MLTHENVAKNLSTSYLLCSPQLYNWGYTNKGRKWCYRGGHQRTCYKCQAGKAPIATLYFLNQHFCHSVGYSNWEWFFFVRSLAFTNPVNIVYLLLFFMKLFGFFNANKLLFWHFFLSKILWEYHTPICSRSLERKKVQAFCLLQIFFSGIRTT